MGGGLSGLHAGAALPPGALRPPQGRVRPGRAGHGVLLAVPLHAAGPGPAAVPRRGRHQRVEELRAPGQEHAHQALPPHRALHLRRPGRAVGRHVGGHRTLVDLPAAVVPALDDRVARHQPPALHRRARGHGAQLRPAGHDAQRAPVVARPLLDRAVQHRLAPGPPRRHGRARGATCPPSMPSWSGPATSPTPSPTRATGRCGRRCRAPTRRPRSRPWLPESARRRQACAASPPGRSGPP